MIRTNTPSGSNRNTATGLPLRCGRALARTPVKLAAFVVLLAIIGWSWPGLGAAALVYSARAVEFLAPGARPVLKAAPAAARAMFFADGCAPTNFSNKTTANGLGSSSVNDVFAIGSTVYAATYSGLSISTDGGMSFTNRTTSNGLGNNFVQGVFAVGSTVYAGTNGGLSISTDGGMSFSNKTTANGLGSDFVYGVYAVGSTVYAATFGGLSISTNGGMSFINKTEADGLGYHSVFDVYASGSTVYAATDGGLSISTDGGTSFINRTSANGLGNNLTRGVVVVGSTVYVATRGGLSISTDGGMSFINKTTGDGVGYIPNDVAVVDDAIYVATVYGLSISTDGGTSWSTRTTANGLGTNAVNGVYAIANSVYAATNGGLAVGNCPPPADGPACSGYINKTTTNGLGNNTVLSVQANGSTVYAATQGGLAISTDDGFSYSNRTTSHGLGNNQVNGVYAIGSTVYAATQGGLSISIDSGASFSNRTTANGLGNNVVNGVYAKSSTVYAATNSGLSISTNSGASFSNRTTANGLGSNTVVGVYADSGAVYAATYGGGLAISTNGGTNFSNKTAANGLGNNFVRGVYAVGSKVYVATENGLSISTDGGTSFSNRTTTNGLGSIIVLGVYASGNTVYAATFGGLSISTDGGASFSNRTTTNGLGNNSVNGVYANDRKVFAGTAGGLAIGDCGPAPEINLKGNGVTIASGDATPSATDGTDFGSAVANTTANSRYFTIENTGPVALNLLGTPKVALTGANATDFSIALQPASPLATGGTTSFLVNFAPTAAGTRTATIRISNDDADENPYTFAIQGTATPAPANGPACASFINRTTANGLGSNFVGSVYASGNMVYATVSGGLAISTDGGMSFTNRTTVNGLGDSSVRGVYVSGGTIYVATNGGLSISTDGGMSFTNKTTADGLGSNFIYGVYANGNMVYAARFGGLSISTDGGMSFTNRTTANGLASVFGNGVYAVGSTVYAAFSGGLGVSTDGGASFSNRTTANGLGSNTVTGVYAVGSTVYVATQGGLSISTDGGTSFTNRTTANGLGGNNVHGVYAAGSTVYAGTDGGLSISTDGGMSFSNRTTIDGLGSNGVAGVFASNNTVYAGTNAGLAIGDCSPMPEINLKGNGTTIITGDATPSATDGTDFGSAVANSGAVAHSFTVENLGAVALNLNGTPKIALSGLNAADFSIGLQPASPVAAGGTTTFLINFAPSATGVRTATVIIPSDDSTENPYTFAIQGTGTPAPPNGSACTSYANRTTTDGLGNNVVNGAYASGSTVYAATNSGLSVSTNSGTSFSNKTTANGLGSNSVVGVYADGSTVYAATYGGGLSISTNGGTSFSNKTAANGLGNNFVRGVYAVGNTVYAATENGLSISTDGGASFTNKSTANGLGSIVILGVFANGSTVYAATAGLSISTDGGASFTNKTTANGLGSNNVQGVYAVGSTVYAATDGGLSISTNGGTSFTNKTTANGLGGNNVQGVYAVGSTVYAATDGGLSISTNGGTSFTNRTTTNGLGSNTVRGVFADSITIYAATQNGLAISSCPPVPEINLKGNGMTIASGDNTPSASDGTDLGSAAFVVGAAARFFTIENIGTGPLNLTGTPKVTLSGGNAAEFSIAVQPASPVAAGGTTSFLVNFAPMALGVRTATVSILSDDSDENPYTFAIQGTGILPGSGIGPACNSYVNRTTANGLGNNQVNSVFADGLMVYAATSGGLSISTDSGTTFSNRTTAHGLGNNLVNSVFVSGGTIYAATQSGLSISTDGGTSFTNKTTADGLGINTVNGVYASGPIIYAATSFGLAVSTDGGTSFTNKTAAANGLGSNSINDVYAVGSTVYAATISGLSISTDGGMSFTNKTTANGLGSNTVNGVYATTLTIYAATNGGLSISTNSGTSFSNRTTADGLGGNSVSGVYAASSTVYAATGGGLSISTNNGASFSNKTTANGLGSNSVNGVYATNRRVFAGTFSGLAIGDCGPAPEINFKGNGITIGNADTTPSASDGTDFGSAAVNLGAVAHYFTIENIGGSDLNLTGTPKVTLSGANAAEFSIALQPASPVAAGTTTSFLVNFAPTGIGTRTATVVLTTDDIDEALTFFTIQGTGTAPPANGPACPSYTNKTTANGLGVNYVRGVFAGGNTIYAGTEGGLAISTNGGASFSNKTTANGLGDNQVNGVLASGATVYAATKGGLSISTDGGMSFSNRTMADGLGYNYVSSVFVAGSTVYAATGNGLSISTDGGASFTNRTTADGLGDNDVHGVYAVGSTVYAATQGGLSISTDGGVSFTNRVTAHGLGSNIVQGVFASGSTVYAATFGGLSISTNGGMNFSNRTSANGLGSTQVIGVYASGSTVYAATGGGLSISTDGGMSFSNKTTANGLGSSIVRAVFASSNTVYAATDGGVAIGSCAPEINLKGNGMTIASGDITPSASDGTDLGSASANTTDTVEHSFTIENIGPAALNLTGSPKVALTGANAGDFSITLQPTSPVASGGTASFLVNFAPTATGTRTATVSIPSDDADENPYTFAIKGTGTAPPVNGPSCANYTNKTTGDGLGSNSVNGAYAIGSKVYAATNGGLSISTDGGTSFSNKTTANGLGINVVRGTYAIGNSVYAATQFGLAVSTDGGMSFSNKTNANGLGDNSVFGVYAIGSTVYVATNGGLSISTDGGLSFSNKTTADGLGSNFVLGVFASGSMVYAATNGAGLSISANGGVSFSNKTTADGLGSNTVNGVYAVGSTVYAATDSGLSLSTDGGMSFSNKTTADGLGSNTVNGVFAIGGTVYAATNSGLSLSTDGGVSFSNKTTADGLGSNIVRGVFASGSTIFAATTGGLALVTCPNLAPMILAGGAFTRQQGSPAGAAEQIATVSDTETPAGTLTVTATTVPTGITVGPITNDNGMITATLAAGCNATPGVNIVTLTVTDGNNNAATADFTVTVAANAPPTVGNYSNQLVAAGSSGTVVTPGAAPMDNGSIASVTATASPASFTGSFVGNTTTGAITINGANPPGAYTVTVTVTDDCGSTVQKTFTLMVNTPPTITAQSGVARVEGSPVVNSQIATVMDAEDAENALQVLVNNGTAATVNSVTVSNLAVNSAGVVTADVVAACGATGASFTLKVTDSFGVAAMATLSVAVTTNPSPTVGNYANTMLLPGAGTTVTPSAAPADNGSIASVVATIAPATFTGTLMTNTGTGAVTIANANPLGSYTITVTVTDNCGAMTTKTFALAVNTPPTIAAQAGVTRQQGSPVSNSQIATVTDPDQALDTLIVTVNSVASDTVNGVTVSNITVDNTGKVFADVVADCTATDATFTLTVTDSAGGTATDTLAVTVTANTAPTVGNYSSAMTVFGSGALVAPDAAPMDNGTISTVTATAPGFGGMLVGNAANGAITVSNAAPVGMFTVTVTVTDNCGATVQKMFTLMVGKADTLTTITSDNPDSSVIGENVTVNFTVAAVPPGMGIPTGMVTITVSGGTESCTGTLVGGAGSCMLALNSVGARTLTATYPGDAGFNGSSDTEAHQVNAAPTTTTITADMPDPSVTGQAYTVTASVVASPPGTGTPTGTITVSDGTGGTCTITLPATSCMLISTTAGAKTLTAVYSGDSNFSGSTSAGVPHTVNKADTTAAIISDVPDPSVVGQGVTVTYTVSVTSPGSGVPTGNVLVSDGVNSCTGTVAAGQCVVALFTPGVRTLTATYQGDANYNASAPSAGEGHQVNKADTTTTITSDNPDPSVFGQTITVNFTVAASAPGAGTPTGNVVIMVSGGTESCTGTVAAGSCTLALTAAGNRTLTATYQGDASYNGSAGTAAHTVNKADATTTIVSDNPDSSTVGQNVTVIFTVVAAAPGVGTPGGNVTISDGVDSCAATVAAGSCVVAFTTPGNRTLTATYNGDANFNTGTDTEPHVVVAPPVIAKSFTPMAVPLNGVSTLTLSITNPAANTVALTGVGLADNFLPTAPGLVVHTTPAVMNSCATGTFNPMSSDTTLTISSATIPVGATCNFSVQVRGTRSGPQVNNASQVTSTNGGTGNSASATLQVNAPPAITPTNLSRAAGSTTLTTTIANATDLEDPEDLLVVQVSTDGTNFFDSVTTGNVTVALNDQNTGATGVNPTAAGAVIATITTPCNATVGSINLFLRVTGTDGQRDTKPWTLTITPNPPPVLGYNPTTVTAGTTLVINPATGPADNGTINPLVLQPVSPATGLALSLNTATGQIMVTGASLIGNYAVTVTATDNCGATTNATFTVNVICPTVTVNPATLPNATVNTAYTQTITASPAGGNYTFAVTSGTLPAGLTLNSNGTWSGAPAQGGTFNFRVAASGWGGCASSRDYTLVVSCPGISITTASLPGGTIGTAYSQTVTASPAGAYSFSVSSGALPPGLTLSAATGAINGTPTTSGTFTFTITANANGCTSSKSFSVAIACAGITLSPASFPTGQAGVAYSQAISITPSGSYTFSLLTGSLPSGVILNPTTGAVSGLPTVTGTFTFTVKALSSGGSGCSATQTYSLVINCPTVSISPASLPDGRKGTAYNQQLVASPSGGNYTFAVAAGSLPTGLNLSPSTGILSGTPTVNSTFTFTIKATGFSSCMGNKSYTLVIGGGGCPAVTLPNLPNGSTGQLYSNSVGASPASDYSYTVTAGSLPPGLTLFASFGVVYGYPTVSGTYPFTITATDSNNCTASKNYTMVINGASLHSPPVNDFDGDRRSDFILWRAAEAQWLIVDSATNAAQTTQWGQAGDVAVAGDYDGDGKADLAAFSKEGSNAGHWRIKLSGNGATLDKAWGLGTDVPVPGDYDGDGKTDLAVWRGAEAGWYIQRSSDGQPQTVQWGTSLAPYFDVPVPGDYDGDGKTDVAVFRQANGHWYIKRSSDGAVMDKAWGLGTDVAVPGDYDGDGKTDIAIWRGSEGAWYMIRSSDGATESKIWGSSLTPYFDSPAVGDYDGDGKADIAIWRKSEGRWYIVQSSDGMTRTVIQGRAGDSVVTATPRQ